MFKKVLAASSAPRHRRRQFFFDRRGTSSRIGSVLLGTVDRPSNVELRSDFTASRLKTDFRLCTSGSDVCQFLNPHVCKLICLPLFVCLCASLSVCLNPCHYCSDWRVETLEISKIIGLNFEQKFHMV